MCESIVDKLIAESYGQMFEILEIIRMFLNRHEDMVGCIRDDSNIETSINAIDSIFSLMLLLQSSVNSISV